MKTKIYKIAAMVLAALMMLSIVSCNTANDTDGKMTLVLAGEEIITYEVSLKEAKIKDGLVSVLDYLKETEGLSYELSGTYLNKVGEIENNAQNAAEGKYLYIYTSVALDADVSQYAYTVEYEGKTLTSTGVGAKDMHIEDGTVIYIGYIIWK